ncbi:MAG: M20/M25/M40 family metallo-hydrolase [Chitinophagaceae bacterium]|nr:M20/M25/M40 family metallo-hydrolase [Chitinophagaceae bacterium]
MKKADKALMERIQAHVSFLADDKLEGRRTGTNGEKLAYEYISNEFSKAGLLAKGNNNSFIQQFPVYEGKQINNASHLIINDNELKLEKEYFPLAFSANNFTESATALALQESGSVWLIDIDDKLKENKNNPHFDLAEAIKTMTDAAADKGATALIVYNTGKTEDNLKFEPKSKIELAKIPVLYLTKDAQKAYLKDKAAILDIKLKVDIGEKNRAGHNVIGYVDNNAATTIVIGGHYDHLGYGEDHNSLHTSTTPMIHNGADDNASGTAAVIELGKMLKKSKFKNNNYVLVCFSGEELGLFGSKYFIDNAGIDISTINYMINMDMIGRLNDSTHGLTIGGYGTSPVWGRVLTPKNDYFSVKFDSSGTGPSDHSSFYRKDIPVLFFFTGTHTDYHKPSDDADKLNYDGEVKVVKYIYDIVAATNKLPKLQFTKTREVAMSGKSSFKVSLGIMPDYAFGSSGVRADGISDGKPAQKAGLKAGDILLQLGEYKFSDVQSYMEVLSKFKKGDATTVKVKRGEQVLTFDIVF